jgi:hypothetical protein
MILRPEISSLDLVKTIINMMRKITYLVSEAGKFQLFTIIGTKCELNYDLYKPVQH